MNYVLASVAVLSAVASVISACLAYQSNRSAAAKHRDSRVRDLSLIANKVVAATIRVEDLGNQLKTAYQTLFTLAGHGAGSSRLKLYMQGVEKKQRGLGPMQIAARETLEQGVAKLSDDRINEQLLEFDGYLANLDRVRERFHVDLASVESQNQTYRQDSNAGRGSTT